MTDTTDTASLKKQIDTAADIIRDLTDKLEAERQRADDRAKENYRNKCDVDNCMETIANLEAEIAALKAEQVPLRYMAEWSSQYGGMEYDYSEVRSEMDELAAEHDGSVIELFTAQQKPVVLLPLPAGIGDFTSVAMKAVRRMDIEAIEAAGGIVKDGE